MSAEEQKVEAGAAPAAEAAAEESLLSQAIGATKQTERSQAEDLLRRMQRYSRPFGTQVVLRRGRLQFLSPSDVRPP